MQEAKAAGVNEAASYMVESSILKDRGEKQLEAQNMLTQALASLSKSKMRGALRPQSIVRLSVDWVVLGWFGLGWTGLGASVTSVVPNGRIVACWFVVAPLRHWRAFVLSLLRPCCCLIW